MSPHTKRSKGKTQPINVFVRVRPINKQETDAHCVSCIEVANGKEVIVKEQRGKKYVFDGVFNPSITQLTVYETVVKPLISEILAGYNCTVFAYGQTGTGKTYTMAGGSAFTGGVHWQDDENTGIIPRALADLFDELTRTQQEYTVRVSYLELYNEELHDLLSDTVDGSKKIKMFDDQRQKGSVILQGIEEQTIHNQFEVYRILEKGQENRRTASTLMNAQSSRSHTVLTITVHTRETTGEGEELVKTGKLNLVDLAGSENISKSGAIDCHAREAGNINQSLLTLGRVIKSAHVPYRESKLTRLLQDSIGGRTKTSIIATISPVTTSLDETRSTLEYANRARNINNRPEVNRRISQKTLLSQYEDEIARLRKDLSAARTSSGIYLTNENYLRMIKEQEGCSKELAKKIDIIRDLEQRLQSTEEQKLSMEEEWNQQRRSFDETNKKLLIARKKLQQMTVKIQKATHLADTCAESATFWFEQARDFLNMIKSSMHNENILLEKAEALHAAAMRNTEAMKKFYDSVEDFCAGLVKELAAFLQGYYDCICDVGDWTAQMQNIHQRDYRISMRLSNSVNKLKSIVDKEQKCIGICINELNNHCDIYINNINDDWNRTRVWQYVEQIFDMDKEQHEKFLGILQEKLRKMSTAAFSTSQDLSTKLNIIQEELLVELDKLFKPSSADAAGQRISDSPQGMRRAVGSRFDALKQELQHTKDTVLSKCQQVEFIKSRVKSVVPAFNNEVQTNIDNITKIKEELDTVVADSNENRPAQLFHATIKMEFGTAKLAEDQIIKAQQLKLSEDMNASRDDYMHASSDIIMEEESALDAQLEKIISSGVSSHSKSSNLSNSALEELASFDDAVAEYGNYFKREFQDCRSDLSSFLNKDLIEIRHGGDTPVHSRRKIPSSLKQPSPMDQKLLKFRQQQMPESPTSNSDVDDPPDTLSLPTIEEFPGPNGGAPDDDRTTHVLPENLRSETNNPDGVDVISIPDSSDTSCTQKGIARD